MKRILKITLLFSAFSIIIFLSYQVITKTQEKKVLKQHLEYIPEFSFLTLDSIFYQKADLSKDTPVIFICFNSECEMCHNEAKSIKEFISSFSTIQLLFISTEPIDKIQQFSEDYQLSNCENVTFLYDKEDVFQTSFDANSNPYLLIYDKNQKLIKRHKGQLLAKGILKELNK